MRKNILTILLFLGFILSYSCTSTPSSNPKEVLHVGYDARITTPAGSFENLENTDKLAPPFNLARLKGLADLELIILSESISKGKTIKVIPIGLLRIKEEGVDTDFVVAVPSNEDLNNLQLKSFGDLSVNNAVSKQIIESWCTQHASLKNRTSIKWLSEQSAIEIISQRSQKTK